MRIMIRLLCLFFCFEIWGQTKTINTIPCPSGYQRKSFAEKSFSRWIRNLPLRENNDIKTHAGKKPPAWARAFYNVYAVLDMPLLYKADLEQCADWAMRLWAEYHKAEKRLRKLSLYDYNGNRKSFKKSGKSFKKFLKWCMAYSNSYSLKVGCKKITQEELSPGDMIVQNTTGGVGHVSVIMDVCENKEGKRLYLIGYSFMPAQEFHIEKSLSGYGKKGWYTLEGYYKYLSEYLDYGPPLLRRFGSK
jgi:hypothetical protein